MESYESDGFKSEKPGPILLYHNLKCIAKLFRIVEIFVGLIFLSWTSTRLPLAVKISSDYFRQLIAIIISPFFTFLLCNVIVLTLLLKAGDLFVGQSPADGEIGTDNPYYDDFVNVAGHDGTDLSNAGSSPVHDRDEVEFEDKETIYEESNNTTVKTGDSDAPEEHGRPVECREAELPESKTEITAVLKDLRRSQSEKLKTESIIKREEMKEGKLRRSETEKYRKVANPGDIPKETVFVFDELSNDEFQRTIETFIAKQIKFHQEEKLAIVLSHA